MLRNRVFFRKTSMGTLEKSCKSHEISTPRSRFAKSDDFQLRNTLMTTIKGRFAPEAENSTILIEKCSGSEKISRIVTWNASEHGPKSRFFRKTSMGTLEKSYKNHEISTSRSRFAKSDDTGRGLAGWLASWLASWLAG